MIGLYNVLSEKFAWLLSEMSHLKHFFEEFLRTFHEAIEGLEQLEDIVRYRQAICPSTITGGPGSVTDSFTVDYYRVYIVV